MKTINAIQTPKSALGCRLARARAGRGKLLRWVVALLFCAAVVIPSRAGPVVDNNAGTFIDNYQDGRGIDPASQVRIVPPGRVSLVPPDLSGHYTTIDIEPTSFDLWGDLILLPYGVGDLTAEVLSLGGASLIGPVSAMNGSISLASLNSPTPVPGIRVRVNLTQSMTVDSLMVTWRPASRVLLDKQAPAEVEAGGNIVYRLRYSVSYVEVKGLVIYDSLASYAAGTLVYPGPKYPQQNDDLTFVSANKGGQYTELGAVVNGVPVPPRSVYWDLGNVLQGITDLLTFTAATRNGTLNMTRATNCAYARAANAAPTNSPCVVTTIRSEPSPLLKKQQGAGIFNVNDLFQTSHGTTNGFSITAQNRPGNGRATMYNTVVYDDVSSLAGVIADRGTPGVPADDFFNISPADGAYVPNYDPDGLSGPLPPIPAIVWHVGTLAPGAAFFGSFAVRLLDQDELSRTNYTNWACLTSDQTGPLCVRLDVQIGLDETPSGHFAKGDNASGLFSIAGATDDNPDSAVPYGGTVGFALMGVNNSLVKLNDLVLLDKIPDDTEFSSAWFDDPNLFLSGARIFYSTSVLFPDPNNPPPVDPTEAPDDLDQGSNAYWEPYDTNPPVNPEEVTWAAFYIRQLDSIHLPNQGTPALPETPITSAVGYFEVNVFSPANQCTDTLLSNRGLFRIYAWTDLNDLPERIPGDPLSYADDEEVVAKGYIGRLLLAGQSTITPDPVELPTLNSTYSVTVQNSAAPTSDALTRVRAVLQLSQVLVNNEPQWPSVQGISPPGSSDNSGKITIDLDPMFPGDLRSIQVTLGLPAGILDGTEYTVAIAVTGEDDQCGISTVTDSARGRVLSSPKLSVFKRQPADLIPSGAEYDYELVYQNLGTGPSTGTWVVERVPNRTVLVRAFGNPNITGVWFSDVDKLPPSALTPFDPITGTIIASHFTLGNPVDDYWVPASLDPARIHWIAWNVDELDESGFYPPQLPLSTPRTVGFRVRNDDDGTGPGLTGSREGTCLPNSAAIFSSELLQAIGNQVITCIDNDPSILVDKIGPSVVEAGVDFNWVVAYHNNTLLTPDETVVITDTLPPGITFVRATHIWNDVALANGAPVGNNGQLVPSSVAQNGGSTTLTFHIAGPTGYRGNGLALAGLEGGVITLTVRADSAAACRTTFVNNACGTATRAGDIVTSCASHQLTVLCPDLEILKYASPANVLAGGELTYQLVVANHGGIAARDVTLTDTLPPGVSYVPGSRSVLAPYSLGEPHTSGQTLAWSVATGNPITRTGLSPGEIPANSGNILIQFKVQVAGSVLACTTLTNCSEVATVSVEEGFYANSACANATVPPPELAVAKSGPALARPGNRVTWNLAWLNQSPQDASGVYLVDTLPNNDADSASDVTFVSVTAPFGVTPYYHAGPVSPPPAFDPANPPANGWSAVRPTSVNHVALLVGPLAGNAGPFTAQVTVDLIDPVSRELPDAGVCFTNTVVIRQAVPDCEDTADNTATAVVCTPALDLTLTKTGSVQGAIPGIAPGQPITYTLTFENSGTVPARGVRVTDTLPPTLVPGTPLDNFTVVELVDAAGNTCRPVDLSGSPILSTVPVTRLISDNVITWVLGTTTPSDTLYYQKVVLPPGCRGSFQLYVTVTNAVADNTEVCNQATVSVPPELGTEELLTNNTNQSCVTVRRADLAVLKSGVGLLTGNPDFVEIGEQITYKVRYNNLGSIAARDVVIDEIVPPDTSLLPVTNLPPGATVTYSPDPTNPTNATSFSVHLGTLPAPANSVSGSGGTLGTPPGGGEGPRLKIDRVVDGAGVTTAVTISWDGTGFVLEVTPQVEGPWEVAPFQPTNPAGRQEVTVPISSNMPNCFFRLRGAGGTRCTPGTNEFPASADPDGFLGWKALYVDQTILPGTDIRYSVGRRDDGSNVYDLGATYTDVRIGPDGLDLSGIDPAHTNLVLRAVLSTSNATNSPCFDKWQFTYASANWPYFTFTVLVRAEPCEGPLPIDNVVAISTTTPEISLANNTASYHMDTRLTDLQVQCGVNVAAALEGETLTNTLLWRVDGPQAATHAFLKVVLPDGDGDGLADVTLGAVTPGLEATAYYHSAPTLSPPEFAPNNPLANGWTTDSAGANHIVFFLGDPAPNSAGSITYSVTVKSGTAGQTLCSSVMGHTARRETKCENNSCSSCTFVGRRANVYVRKPDPGCVHPGEQVTFTIEYGNNGNTSAANVVLADVLPAGLTFISADPAPTGPGPTWDNLGVIPGTLGVLETNAITVVARLDTNCALLNQALVNVATISTSSEETDVGDNRDEAPLCITADVVSLSGYVYHDRSGDCLRDPGEAVIPGVTIMLTGTDWCGVPVALTNVTDTGGQYYFTGLNPGSYTVTETQPATWFSTGDSLGTVGGGPPRGENTNPLDDLLGPITLVGGDLALDYNFCENTVSACLRITNEVVTCVSNGTYLYTFCATNLFHGPISYLTLLDPPPGVTFTPDILSPATPLQPGQGQCFTVTIEVTGAPAADLCFRFGAHTTNLIQCCAVEHCLTLPQCCAEVVDDSAAPIPGQPNCYSYTFSLRNETAPPTPIQYLILVPDPANDCFSFTPDILVLNTPLLPGQTVTRTVTLCVTSPCPAPFCFMLSAHDTNFNLCCAVQHCLTNAPIRHRPVVFADGFDGSVHPAAANITVPLVIDTSVVQPTLVTVSAGADVIRTILAPADGPLSVTWSNVSAGAYMLTAAALDEFGGVWFSDPATVTVVAGLAPAPAPRLLTPVPRLLSPALLGGKISFSIRTEAGVTWHVEYTDSLSSPAWTVLHSAVGDGSVTTVAYPLTHAGQRFYRVRVE